MSGKMCLLIHTRHFSHGCLFVVFVFTSSKVMFYCEKTDRWTKAGDIGPTIHLLTCVSHRIRNDPFRPIDDSEEDSEEDSDSD